MKVPDIERIRDDRLNELKEKDKKMEKEKDKRKNMIDKKLKEDKYGNIVEEDDYVIKSMYQPQP